MATQYDHDPDACQLCRAGEPLQHNPEPLVEDEPKPGCGFCCRRGDPDYGHCGHDCHDENIAVTYANVRPRD